MANRKWEYRSETFDNVGKYFDLVVSSMCRLGEGGWEAVFYVAFDDPYSPSEKTIKVYYKREVVG
jgi:hypothetical protein